LDFQADFNQSFSQSKKQEQHRGSQWTQKIEMYYYKDIFVPECMIFEVKTLFLAIFSKRGGGG
jgi:hypothetical protein